MPRLNPLPSLTGACQVAALSLGLACTQGETSQQVARADTLVRGDKFAEALNESRRALQADSNNSGASRVVGRAHLELGEVTQAYHALLRAQALDPDDVDVQVNLGNLYLIEGNLDLAREQAERILRRDSTHIGGLLVLAGAARTVEDVDAAIQKFRRVKSTGQSDVRPALALAILNARKDDTASAGKLFRDAVAANAKSLEAHSVAAAYYAERGDPAGVDRERRAANALATSNLDRLKAAKFYVLLGVRGEAKRALQETAAADSATVAAARLLAELHLTDANADEALKVIAPLLQKNPGDAEALIQRGRVYLLQRNAAGALADFRAALRAAPGLAPTHFYLAMARLQATNLATAKSARDSSIVQARAELDRALKLAKGYPEAALQLAQLNLDTDKPRAAIATMEPVVTANPRLLSARFLLGQALTAAGRPAEALEAYQGAVEMVPRSAEAHFRLGSARLVQRDRAGAIKEFETAIKLAPSFGEPMNQLVMLDLGDGQADRALNRINKQLAAAPNSAPLYDLLGWVQAVRKDNAAAEAALLKSIQLEPNLLDARIRLAELYGTAGEFDKAITHAEYARRIDPGNVRALMALGVAQQSKGEIVKAQQTYEAALALDPRNSVVANNLAYLFSEQAGQQDQALKYASLAAQLSPQDPHVTDTLGWVLFQRGDLENALAALKVAAQKLPDSPAVQYHLGMAAQKYGDVTLARTALTKAVGSPTDFSGKEEARKALAQLK